MRSRSGATIRGAAGSRFMHEQVKVGDQMKITYPVNLFSLDLRARKHLFLAGGIGITPFMAMIQQLKRTGGSWELHYGVRSAALGSYAQDLQADDPHHVHVYCEDQDQHIALENCFLVSP